MKVLYIAGSDRSGSTLLCRMLGTIEGFFAAGEMGHFLDRGTIGNELCGCGVPFGSCRLWSEVVEAATMGGLPRDHRRILELKTRVATTRHVPALLSSVSSSVFKARLDTLAQYLSQVYQAIESVTAARVIVDSSKNAAYAHVLRRSSGVDLRVLHLIRDSRGVAFSWAKTKRRPEATAKTEYMDRHGSFMSGFLWNRAHLGAETLRYIGLPYLRVRYEELIADPVGVIERIVRFVGETPHALQQFQNGTIDLGVQHILSGNPMRLDRHKITIKLDNPWAVEMAMTDKLVVSAVTLPLLARYGYIAKKVRAR